MVVDIAPQQQLTEVFTTNRSHHRSSSNHRRNSTTTTTTTITTTSSVVSNNNTMTNGYRSCSDELGKKAEQILGQPKAVLDCRRQTSMDFHTQYAPRLNITESKSTLPSRSNATNTTSSTTVHNQPTSDSSNGKNKRSVTVEHLVPLILQLVAAPKLMKFPEMISRRRSNSKPIENILESREMTLVLHRESAVQLSDDENDEDDTRNSTTVLTELADNKINNNSSNQNNSNDNHPPPPPPHAYENQIEPQHSGISSSRCQEDDDSEDEDSDNQEAVHSDAENEDETNETNPHTFSLMDFVRVKEIHSEPVDSSLKHSPSQLKKRSISPEPIHHVYNSEDHQNKRQKVLLKQELLKSFMSSVNTKINFKRPALPITIPTHLFLDQTSSESLDERSQRISKRSIHGLPKHDDVIDGSSQFSSNNQIPSINGLHQKKNKTSHVQEKTISRQDSTTILKNEHSISTSTGGSLNETDNKTRATVLPTTATVNPMVTLQPKKEKPTANVKPLLQSTPIDNLSTTNSINNGINISDSLTTTNSRSMLPSTKKNYAKLKNMSKTELATLARKKKKQADCSKRTTFIEAREVMGLYLESVCYFIQCANDEVKQDQRTSLLTTTLTMLQQLAQNHKKMFQLSNANPSGDLYSLQQKFLLINYWLQSFIYHLQLNTHMPTLERYANQVTEYFHQSKHPSSTKVNNQTPINDNNPISPLSTTSQTSSSDLSTTSGTEQHRYMFEFSKVMLNSYHSTYYWNKAESLMREKSLKEFIEQLLKQNQNRRLSRDDPTFDFLLYIFDSIELLRLSVA